MTAPPPLPGMIVLAGGLGTRLQGSIDPDLPKILAPIHGRPFLDYLLAWCAGQNLARIRFALGHRADPVIARLQAAAGHLPLPIDWSIEAAPLGTAGALAMALGEGWPGDAPCLVMNGDTLVDVALAAFCAQFRRTGAEVGLVAARVRDPGRYGALTLDDADRVLRFAEKRPAGRDDEASWINAGIYLLSPAILAAIRTWSGGSLERDLLSTLPAGAIWAFRGARRFIDIGTHDALDEAQRLLAPLAGRSPAGSLWSGS